MPNIIVIGIFTSNKPKMLVQYFISHLKHQNQRNVFWLKQILFHTYNLGSCSKMWSSHTREKSLIQVKNI